MSPTEEIGYEIAAEYNGMISSECYEIEFKEKVSPVFESNTIDLDGNDINANEEQTNKHHYKRPQEVEDALLWIQSRHEQKKSIPKTVYTAQSCLNQASMTHNEDRESENTVLETRVEDSLRTEKDADIVEDLPLQSQTSNTICPSSGDNEVNTLQNFTSPQNGTESGEVKSELKIITEHVEIPLDEKFLSSNHLDSESSIHHTSRCIGKQEDDQVMCKNSQEDNCCVDNNDCMDAATQLLDSAVSRSGPNDALPYNQRSYDKVKSKPCDKSNSISSNIPEEIGPVSIGNHVENESCQSDEKIVEVFIAKPESPLVPNIGEEEKSNEEGEEAPPDSLQARKSVSIDSDKDDSSSIDVTLSSAFGSQETTLAGNKSADKGLFGHPCLTKSFKSEEDINSNMNTDESSESSSFLKSFQPIYPLELLSNVSFENDSNVDVNNSMLTPDIIDNCVLQDTFLGDDEQMSPRELNSAGENVVNYEGRKLNHPAEKALNDDSGVNENTLAQSIIEEIIEKSEEILGAKANVDSNQVSDGRNEETVFDDDNNVWIEATSSSSSDDKFTIYQYRMLNISSFELDEKELGQCLRRISQNADEEASTQCSASAYSLCSNTATTADEILSNNAVHSNPTFLSTDSIDEDEIIEDESEINYICDALKLIVTAPLILWQGKEKSDVCFETDEHKIGKSSKSKLRKTYAYKAINEDTNEALQRVTSFTEMLAFTPREITNNIEDMGNLDNDLREAIEHIASRVYYGRKISSSFKIKNCPKTHDEERVEMNCSQEELADFIKTFSNDFYIGCAAMRGDEMGIVLSQLSSQSHKDIGR